MMVQHSAIDYSTEPNATLTPKPMSEGRKKFLHYCFTTALEGGIGYWAEVSEYHWGSKKYASTVCGTEMVDDLDGFYAILELAEGEWGVEDAYITEEGEVKPITETQALKVDREVIKRGVDTLVKAIVADSLEELGLFSEYAKQFVIQFLTDLEEGDSDAVICDWVVQFGLFGGVLYG